MYIYKYIHVCIYIYIISEIYVIPENRLCVYYHVGVKVLR